MRSTEGGEAEKDDELHQPDAAAAKPVTQLWVCLLFYSFTAHPTVAPARDAALKVTI